jgi:hypothetical protein
MVYTDSQVDIGDAYRHVEAVLEREQVAGEGWAEVGEVRRGGGDEGRGLGQCGAVLVEGGVVVLHTQHYGGNRHGKRRVRHMWERTCLSAQLGR